MKSSDNLSIYSIRKKILLMTKVIGAVLVISYILPIMSSPKIKFFQGFDLFCNSSDIPLLKDDNQTGYCITGLPFIRAMIL